MHHYTLATPTKHDLPFLVLETTSFFSEKKLNFNNTEIRGHPQ